MWKYSFIPRTRATTNSHLFLLLLVSLSRFFLLFLTNIASDSFSLIFPFVQTSLFGLDLASYFHIFGLLPIFDSKGEKKKKRRREKKHEKNARKQRRRKKSSLRVKVAILQVDDVSKKPFLFVFKTWVKFHLGLLFWVIHPIFLTKHMRFLFPFFYGYLYHWPLNRWYVLISHVQFMLYSSQQKNIIFS